MRWVQVGEEPALWWNVRSVTHHKEGIAVLFPWTISSLKQPILNHRPQVGVDCDCLGQELLTQRSWNLTSFVWNDRSCKSSIVLMGHEVFSECCPSLFFAWNARPRETGDKTLSSPSAFLLIFLLFPNALVIISIDLKNSRKQNEVVSLPVHCWLFAYSVMLLSQPGAGCLNGLDHELILKKFQWWLADKYLRTSPLVWVWPPCLLLPRTILSDSRRIEFCLNVEEVHIPRTLKILQQTWSFSHPGRSHPSRLSRRLIYIFYYIYNLIS